MTPVTAWLRDLGPLRMTLAVFALVAIAFLPPPNTESVLEGWGFIHTIVIPVLAPMVFMVLMLDTLMSRVFMSSATDGDKRRYRRILITHLVLGAGILIRFVPFIMALAPR